MILGTKDVTEMLKNASELEISKAISKGIKLVQSAARAECPVDHGELRGSIFTVVETEGRNVTGICYTDKKYGHPGGSTKAAARMRWIGQPRKNMAGFTLTHRKGDFISVPASLRSLFYIQH